MSEREESVQGDPEDQQDESLKEGSQAVEDNQEPQEGDNPADPEGAKDPEDPEEPPEPAEDENKEPPVEVDVVAETKKVPFYSAFVCAPRREANL